MKMKICERIRGMYLKAKNKEGGFNVLVTTTCLILIVMILILAFRSTVETKINSSITSVGNQIESITSEMTGGTTTNP